jgi:catechol 2,3-dioxygenase-like lactoylglutathione lyase family enzyme
VAVRLLALSVDAHDPHAQAAFWGHLLGRPVSGPVVRAGEEPDFELRFRPGATDKTRANWIHVHLTSAHPGDQERTVARALALGATHLDVGQTPEEGHVVLADPDGNEFCVIEAGNRYLAGTGFLGELACDGSRDVGLFWSAALGWPLNWDQDEETSVQSPLGGTKISWGGPPLAPKTGRRMGFDLGADDLAAELDRLVALGATRLGQLDDGVELADPDGNEFSLRPA